MPTKKSDARVCVTCVGGRLIYDIVRGIRLTPDLNVYIHGVDSDPNAHGRLLCDAFSTVPKADDQEAYVERIESLHQANNFNVLLTLSEDEGRAVARFRDRLISQGIQVSVSEFDIVDTLTDKLTLLQKATAAGIDTGYFRRVDTVSDAISAIDDLKRKGQKAVIKPRRGAGSRGVMIIDVEKPLWTPLLPNRFCGIGDTKSVFAAMEREGMGFEGLLAQTYIDGPVYDVDCISKDGRLCDVAARLRQLRNPLSPTSTGHKIDQHPAVIAMAERLCSTFQIDGAADFDIALGADETPVLFDAAARFSGSVGGSLTAGANFPGQLVRMLLGYPRVPMSIRGGTVLRPYITMAEVPLANELDFL